MSGRIYIRDFSYDATAEDLSALISKICPVEEVYISGKTPTGINRSFAIVVLNGTDLLIEKCIKTFNNCHWKGTKIWVEKAKVYYKDKFEMERARERKIAAMRLHRAENVEEEAELDDFEKSLLAEIDAGDAEPDAIENDDTVPESVVVIKKVKSSLKHVIKLKKNRDSIPVAISMVPTSSSTASAKKSKKYVSCGRRTVFDYDDSGSIAYTPMEAAETSGDDTSDDSSDEDSVEEALQIKPSKENSAKGSSKVKDAKVAVTAAAASDSNKAQGGGSRKGFGGLSTVPVSALPVPLSQAYLKKLVSTTPVPVSSEVDCCIETAEENRHIGKASKVFGLDEDDLRNDAEKESIEFAGDDDNRNPYRVDDVACVDASELTDEALQGERQRSLNMLALIMKSSNSEPTTVPLVHKKNNEKINATEEKKNKTSGNKEVMKLWELSKPQRFDPTKKSASTLELSADDAEKRNNAALATLAAINLLKQQEEEEVALRVAAETVALEKIKADDNYANLDSLKSIFHQEGGVWWGDDGTLNDAVSKGTIADDALFREAEKHGIDIRKKRVEESALAAQASTGDDKVSESTKMTFGFFDDYFATDSSAVDVPDKTSVTLPLSNAESYSSSLVIEKSFDETDTNKMTEIASDYQKGNQKTNTVDLIIKQPSVTIEIAKKESHNVASSAVSKSEQNEEGIVHSTEEEIVTTGATMPSTELLDEMRRRSITATFMTVHDILKNAKKFCRSSKEQDLIADWRAGREQLVIDYKRKCQDAKKKLLENAKPVYPDLSTRPPRPEGSTYLGKRGREGGSDHSRGSKGGPRRGVIRKIMVK